MRKFYAAIMALVLLLTLAACGGAKTQPAGAGATTEPAKADPAKAQPAKELQTVKIGILGSRSGASATLGQYLDAAIAAIRKANDDGGINGYKFEIVLRDDEANPTKSTELAKELIYKEKVVAIIGPTNTSNALAIMPLVFEAKIPLIDPVATGTGIMPKAVELAKGGPNWFFMVTTSDDVQAGRLVKFVKDHQFKKPVIIHDDTAYGKGGGGLLAKQMEQAGVKAVKVITHNYSSPDLTPQMLQAKEAGADIVLLWSLGHDQAQAAKAKAKLGWDVPLVGSTAMQMANFRALAGDAAQGGLSIWPAGHVRPNPARNGQLPARITEGYNTYLKYYGNDANKMPLENFGSAMFAYDAGMIVVQAIGAVGPDPAKIRDYIETQPHKNVGSKDVIQFTKDNHFVWKVEDLTMVLVKKDGLEEYDDTKK
ncbi:MAG: ABC transporter substrate-binding protein [Bacillota bacterium]